MSEIHLSDIVDNLDSCLIKLDKKFFKLLLENASKTKEYWKNEDFVKSVGYNFNKEVNYSTGLIANYNKNKAIKVSTLKRILELSDYNWEDIETNFVSIRAGRHDGEVFIRFPIEIDNNLGCIVGHILGDGSIDKKYNQIFYTNSNKDLINEFRNSIYNIFNIEPRIWIQKSGNFKTKSKWIKRVKNLNEINYGDQVGLFYPKIVGILLFSMFGKFAVGKRKETTKEIMNSNVGFKIGLLRAFYDDEGSVDMNRTIRVYQDNKEILIKIKEMLKILDIDSNPIIYYNKENKRRHYFSITGYFNFKKFYKNIGFTSKKKNETLKFLIQSIDNSKNFRLKKYEIKNTVINILQNGTLTTNEIKQELHARYPTIKWENNRILEHLNELSRNKILVKRRQVHAYLWST